MPDLGATMGAIFTAGGLVVAIVSTYTMANVQSVARRSVRPLLDAVPEQIGTRIRRFLEAYGYYTTARDIVQHSFYGELDLVELWLEKAVALEPTISGLYAWAGQIYYGAAGSLYLRERNPSFSSYDQKWTLPAQEAFPSIAAKALSWLEQALHRSDGNVHELAAELAELHGMMGSPLRMTLRWVSASNAGSAKALPSCGGRSLLFLFGSCRSDVDVVTLSNALGIEAPLAPAAIKRWLEALLAGPEPTKPLTLIALPKFTIVAARNPVSPGLVSIFHLQSGTEGFAQWLPSMQSGPTVQFEGIPAFGPPNNTGAQARPDPIPMDELLEKVTEQFNVLGQFDDSAPFPERSPSA
ncbi:MAG: hypothetical protein ACXVAO_18915 [Vulcanimicrobiaceae bacterium]